MCGGGPDIIQQASNALAGLDQSVSNAIPGGWTTVGALAATVLTAGAASGALAADTAVAGTTQLADGTVVTTMSDGTIATTAADGTTTYAAADGTPLASIDTSTTAMPNADPNVGAQASDLQASAPTPTSPLDTLAQPTPSPLDTAAPPASPPVDTVAPPASPPVDTAPSSSFSLQAPSSYVPPSSALTTDVSGAVTAPSLGVTSGGTVGSIVAPTTGAITVDPTIAAATGAGALSTATGGLPTVGSITAPLSGSGAIPGAGAVTSTAGLTGALPAGVVVGDGTGGTIAGMTYIDAGGGVPALDAAGNPIPASSVGIGGIAPSSSFSLSDLNNLRRAYSTAKSLLGSNATPTAMGAVSPTAPAPVVSGGLSAANTPSSGMPQATLLQGKQVASPLPSSYNVPVENLATVSQQYNPAVEMPMIQSAATGGLMQLAEGSQPDELSMSPNLMRGKQAQHASLFGMHGVPLYSAPHLANGGEPNGFNPEFYSEGGLKNSYVRGAGTGTSDSIPAMLSNGEFVIPADVVSSLGDGSNDAGAKVLDSFMRTIRDHKRKHDAKHLPAPSKGALGYLLEAKRKVKT